MVQKKQWTFPQPDGSLWKGNLWEKNTGIDRCRNRWIGHGARQCVERIDGHQVGTWEDQGRGTQGFWRYVAQIGEGWLFGGYIWELYERQAHGSHSCRIQTYCKRDSARWKRYPKDSFHWTRRNNRTEQWNFLSRKGREQRNPPDFNANHKRLGCICPPAGPVLPTLRNLWLYKGKGVAGNRYGCKYAPPKPAPYDTIGESLPPVAVPAQQTK